MTPPDLSIVIPTYNESVRLPETLRQVFAFVDQTARTCEVLVSDDGSTDGTPKLVARDHPRCRVLDGHANQGKGAAVRRGMLAAEGALRLFSDADLSTPIEEVEGMIEAMERDGHDVVIASRAAAGARLEIRQPWWREASGRLFNRMVRALSGLPWSDTQCGFKLFRADAAQSLFSQQCSDGWAFDVELLMLAREQGLSVHEYPVRWRDSADSRLTMWRDAPKMLADIVRFRRRHPSRRNAS